MASYGQGRVLLWVVMMYVAAACARNGVPESHQLESWHGSPVLADLPFALVRNQIVIPVYVNGSGPTR